MPPNVHWLWSSTRMHNPVQTDTCHNLKGMVEIVDKGLPLS